MSEKRFIGRELKKNPTGIKILRTETSPTNEDQFVHDELQEIIKQEHDLSDQESSNSMDINEQTELDFEKPLLSHALNSLNNHQEIEVTIQTLETFRDDIGKFSMLPPFWLYMEVPNGLEFMRLDPATMLIKNHLRLNEELSVTVIFPNKDELLLDVKINSYSNTYDYLNSVENWPQCCGTQFEDEKYSDKCKGVVVGEDTYKRNQKYQRCKYCKILRSRLQNRKSTSTSVTKQIAPNTAEPCKDLEIMNTLKTAHSLKEDGDPEIKIEQEADMEEDYADEHLIEFDNDDDDFTSQIKYEMIEEPFRLADESETRKSSRLHNKAQNVEHLTEAITTDKSLDENNLKVKESKPKKVSKPKQETEKAVEAKKVKLSTKKAKEKKDDTKLLCGGLCNMSKPYVRKSDRGAAYTQEKLREAVEAVKKGAITAYAASKLYGIPRPTIVNRVYGRKGLKSNTLGRPTALPLDVEKSLAENLHIMEKYGFGLTRKEVLEVVGQYVVENNIETPFKDGIPGEDWFYAFKKRHDLSFKQPQPVEYARKKACSPAVIHPYFDLLEKTLDELGLRDKPSHIWNAGETSFSKDPSKSKVVGLGGDTSTRTILSPGKTNTTVLLACNAAGEKAPPLIVYEEKSVWDTWTSEDGYPGTQYAATSNGWMETSVFETFIEKVFLPAIGDKRPILLIYDGHSTYLSIKVIQTARDHNITIMKIPPHSSDYLQPLDLAVNKSFKDMWDVALLNWQRLNIGKVLPEKDFSRIIGEVWTQIDPIVCATGFRKAGIFPFNKDDIPENKFDPLLLAE